MTIRWHRFDNFPGVTMFVTAEEHSSALVAWHAARRSKRRRKKLCEEGARIEKRKRFRR